MPRSRTPSLAWSTWRRPAAAAWSCCEVQRRLRQRSVVAFTSSLSGSSIQQRIGLLNDTCRDSLAPGYPFLEALFPTFCGTLVPRTRVNPALAVRGGLLFPERGAGLEIIHDELAGGKSIAAVAGCHAHEHDLVHGLQLPDPVDDRRILNLPAPAGRLHDL